jgi:hypothetical protein
MTVQPNETAEVLNRPISQELVARDLTRLPASAPWTPVGSATRTG